MPITSESPCNCRSLVLIHLLGPLLRDDLYYWMMDTEVWMRDFKVWQCPGMVIFHGCTTFGYTCLVFSNGEKLLPVLVDRGSTQWPNTTGYLVSTEGSGSDRSPGKLGTGSLSASLEQKEGWLFPGQLSGSHPVAHR